MKKSKESPMKNKGGRPKFEIDFEAVEKLARLHCTQAEIASFLGCNVKTIHKNKRFLEVYKKGLDLGKMSIRRAQYKALESGNVTMSIWLGKQYLGQTDRTEIVATKTPEEVAKAIQQTYFGYENRATEKKKEQQTIN